MGFGNGFRMYVVWLSTALQLYKPEAASQNLRNMFSKTSLTIQSVVGGRIAHIADPPEILMQPQTEQKHYGGSGHDSAPELPKPIKTRNEGIRP